MKVEIIVATISGITFIAGALLAFHGNRTMNKANAFSTNTTTLLNLWGKVDELSQTIINLRNEVDDIKDKNRVLWAYTYQVLEVMRVNGIQPPEPPDELKSDERLMTLIKWINEKKTPA